jgi:hypothetical protein
MARRVVIVFCALLAAGVGLWFATQPRGRAREVQGPSATFRAEVDLGERDINRTVEATIFVARRGGSEVPLALRVSVDPQK